MNAPEPAVILGVVFLSSLIAWVVVLRRGWARMWLLDPPHLPVWTIRGSDFLGFLLLVVLAWLFVPLGVGHLLGLDYEEPVPGRTYLVTGLVMNLSGLVVCLAFQWHPAGTPPRGYGRAWRAVGRAVMVWFLLLPVIGLAAIVWLQLVKALGHPGLPQESIGFIRDAASNLERIAWGVLVVVVAPVTEELVYRRGLFRFLAARLRLRPAAALSAVIFAAMHQNVVALVPLTILGFALALVYDRTGRLVAPIVLHAIFNLATYVSLWFQPPA